MRLFGSIKVSFCYKFGAAVKACSKSCKSAKRESIYIYIHILVRILRGPPTLNAAPQKEPPCTCFFVGKKDGEGVSHKNHEKKITTKSEFFGSCIALGWNFAQELKVTLHFGTGTKGISPPPLNHPRNSSFPRFFAVLRDRFSLWFENRLKRVRAHTAIEILHKLRWLGKLINENWTITDIRWLWIKYS